MPDLFRTQFTSHPLSPASPSHGGTSGLRDRGGRPAPGRMGLHLALHAGVHGHEPAVPRPLAGDLALKVNSLVGIEQAPSSLSLVAGRRRPARDVRQPVLRQAERPHLVAWGMRRPWMIIGLVGGSLGVLVVAVAPNIAVVLVGWCIAQLFLNALLAAQVAVLPDQVPVDQRGLVAGVLGVCLPVASVGGPSWCSSSVATSWPCSWPRARSVGSSSCCSPSPWTTVGSTRRTGRRGRCASSPARSTSTRARTRTSRGRSPAGSCSSWPTRS